MMESDVGAWAHSEFATARLGDIRRVRRLVQMARGAATRPSGCVLDVYRSSAERQGAYDLLESSCVPASEICRSMGVAAARRVRGEQHAFVAVDGSSLTLTDAGEGKDFGSIGATSFGARGLKVISAYAMMPSGVPVGVLHQSWWAREAHRKRLDCHSRKLKDKETRYWVETVGAAKSMLTEHAPETRAWFVVDREGDNYSLLRALETSGALFTVRSRTNRRLAGNGEARYMFEPLHAIVLGRLLARAHELAGGGAVERVDQERRLAAA